MNLPQKVARKAILAIKAPFDIYLFTKENDTADYGSFPIRNNFCNSFGNNRSNEDMFKKCANKLGDDVFSYEKSDEYRILVQTFSSGATLKEYVSIATILSTLLPQVKEPSRTEKRSFVLLMKWFKENWELIFPVLPFIQLRDENKKVIDGQRELYEMHSHSK